MDLKKKPWGRRLLALALCAALSVSALSVYAAATDGVYLDTAVHWCREPIRFWSERRVVEGVGGDLFLPDSPITRQTAAVVICRFLGLAQTPVTEDPFPDVPASSPYAPAIAACKRAGLVFGYPNGLYGPEDGIVRNAAMVLLARVYHFTPREDLSALSVFRDGDKAAPWARGYIAAMVEADIVHGWSEKLRDADICTRAEFVEMLRCFVSAYYDMPGLYDLGWIKDGRFIAFVTGDITLTGERPFRKADGEKRPFRRDGERPFRRADGERPFRRADGERPFRKADGEKRPYRKDGERPFRRDSARKPHFTGEKRSFRNKT